MNGAQGQTKKTVFYFNFIAHQRFLDVIATRPDIELHKFHNDSPKEDVKKVMAVAHAYQIDSARAGIPEKYYATQALLDQCPNLLIVSANGAGFDTVDVPACTEAGVLVMNQTGGNREAVAEHALGMILALSKRIAETDRAMRDGSIKERLHYMGDEVSGKTLGIIGIGNTGSTLSKKCAAALDMRVLAYDPYVDADTMARFSATKAELDEVLAQADYVSVHCPRTNETETMFDADAFARMKQGSYFITTARGGIHDEAALYDALKAGHLKGAGLDVWDPEPPAHDHPLLTLDNVIVSPHTAGSTFTARENLGKWGAEQLTDALDGKRPPRLINPDAWPQFTDRYEEVLGTAAADA